MFPIHNKLWNQCYKTEIFEWYWTIGSAKYLLFLQILKKTTEYFLKFLFLIWKYNPSGFRMENNFIQMAASAFHEVAYTIGPNFSHIIDYVQLYFTNGFTNIVL